MKNFLDIKHAVPKEEKVIVAPSPLKEQSKYLNELKENGFQVEIESGITPEDAVRNAFKRVHEKQRGVLVQGGMPLETFWRILQDCGVDRNRLCHVSVFEDFRREKLLFVADTYIHNFPSLREKINILELAIELVASIGIEHPLVAALSALESVNPALPSTVEAAALSKMSQRGQFAAEIEGPLDIDTALSKEAALRKKVHSNVPGDVDLLLCPDIESAYALSQFFTWLGKMPTAGVLLGTPIPVVINPSHVPPDHKGVEIAIKILEGVKSYA